MERDELLKEFISENISLMIGILIIVCAIAFIIVNQGYSIDEQCKFHTEKQCFLRSNVAFGTRSHRVSCNGEYTYWKMMKTAPGCFDRADSEEFYD